MTLSAFDGTWNQEKGDDSQYTNTNVARFFNAYHAHSGANDLYRSSVGTRFDVIGAVLGGAFGLGELVRLIEAYDHLCGNWVVHRDTVIDIIGFSRGAATTLDFCHHLLEKGIRRPGSNEEVEPSPQIRFLGVWDVVGAFGLASLGKHRARYRPPSGAAAPEPPGRLPRARARRTAAVVSADPRAGGLRSVVPRRSR